MPVGLDHPQELLKINGIRLSVGSAGIYSKKRNDIALMEISLDSVVSAAFTKNHFCAAPVRISKSNLNHCLVNSICLSFYLENFFLILIRFFGLIKFFNDPILVFISKNDGPEDFINFLIVDL